MFSYISRRRWSRCTHAMPTTSSYVYVQHPYEHRPRPAFDLIWVATYSSSHCLQTGGCSSGNEEPPRIRMAFSCLTVDGIVQLLAVHNFQLVQQDRHRQCLVVFDLLSNLPVGSHVGQGGQRRTMFDVPQWWTIKCKPAPTLSGRCLVPQLAQTTVKLLVGFSLGGDVQQASLADTLSGYLEVASNWLTIRGVMVIDGTTGDGLLALLGDSGCPVIHRTSWNAGGLLRVPVDDVVPHSRINATPVPGFSKIDGAVTPSLRR